jgi:glyoxylase-like metal-dependent hydrolase (beta-lactamase superfamily II)
MKINFFPLGMIGANCVFLSDCVELVIFDPGDEPQSVADMIEKGGYVPKMILCTHGHFDHICAAEYLSRRYGIDVYMHRDDFTLAGKAKKTALQFGVYPTELMEEIREIADGDEYMFNGAVIKAIHTPGHTVGSVCFYIEALKCLISGDTLFNNSIGRTDLEGSIPEALVPSIREKLYVLPEDTVVIAGHGDTTTIGKEMRCNQFVRAFDD